MVFVMVGFERRQRFIGSATNHPWVAGGWKGWLEVILEVILGPWLAGSHPWVAELEVILRVDCGNT